jgi:iron complex outermembrane receptor protein
MVASSVLSVLVGFGASSQAFADEARVVLDIPAQPLSSALEALRTRSNIQLLYSADLVGRRNSPAVRGELSAEEALKRLLRGTGLEPRASGANAYAIVRTETDASLTKLPEVVVNANRERQFSSTMEGAELASKRQGRSDTAQLISDVLGVSVAGAGGVSGLPAIQGLGDQRVLTLVDGMQLSAACANHMNPPLSYISPSQVGKMEVMTNLSPVSAGGDNIGGTIVVHSAVPAFAASGEGIATHGRLSTFYRSNNAAVGTTGSASVGSEDISLGYSGSWSQASNYSAGGGGAVPLTRYNTQNHAVTLAARDEANLLVLEGGGQWMPYQGFANQPMDMTQNRSWFTNIRHEGDYNWGRLDSNTYFHTVSHKMNDLAERSGNMPMNTEGQDYGYGIKADLPLSDTHSIRIGNEFHAQRLDDIWPFAGSGFQELIEINNGQRDRFGNFIELESKWTSQWATVVGLRADVVRMDADPVQGYFAISNYASARLFNSIDRHREDVNVDGSALLRYEPDQSQDYQFGVARKTRSPDLYERYNWQMTNMVGWSGDGNNYQGNPWLKPEIAYTIGATAKWHDEARKDWEITASPYYTYVHNYIDVNDTGTSTLGTALGQMPGGRKIWKLQYVNTNADIFGFDLGGKKLLIEQPGLGSISGTAKLGFQRGHNISTGNSLYRMMPLNAKFGLEHALEGWTNGIEVEAVDGKTHVDPVRHDPTTPGYALVNLKSSYSFGKLRIDGGISNLFDHRYYQPLGGTNSLTLSAASNTGPRVPLLAEGRSFNLGMTVEF